MKKAATLFLIMSCLISFGCANQRGWTYSAEPAVVSTPMINKTIVVPPFSDQRKKDNDNYVGLHLIPLSPGGYQELNTPETVQGHCGSGLWTFKPTEDFAKATAEELNNARIFKEAFFSYKTGDGEFLLQGRIDSTRYYCTVISYGLSVYGSLFWILGFPCGTYENQLELNMQVIDQRDRKVVWQKDYKKSMDGTAFLYKMGPDFNYDIFLKDILKDALVGIRAAATNITSKP